MMATVVVKVMKMTMMMMTTREILFRLRKLRTASTEPDQLHSKSADSVRSHRDLPRAHSRRFRKLSVCGLSYHPLPPHSPVRGTLTMTFFFRAREKIRKGKERREKERKKSSTLKEDKDRQHPQNTLGVHSKQKPPRG